ncbi:MAG: MFS transporter [candidate division KSB1 bacterium]|nr:MFS transporter [candidate division KSB1 bacterium]
MKIAALQALKYRNFRLFIGGQIFSLIGIWGQHMAQSWLVYELTGSAVWLGIIDAANALPMLLFSLLGGSLADQLPKRRLLIYIHFSGMLLAAVYAFLVFSDVITIYLIVVLALLGGFLVALEYPIRQAIYIEMVGEEALTNAIALNSATFNLARLVGPAIGGYLVSAFGVAWCMAINSASYLTIIISLFLIKLKEDRTKTRRTVSFRRSMKQVFIYIREQRPIKGLLVLVAAMTVFGWSFMVMLPVLAKEVLGGGALVLGHLMSAAGLGALMASILVAVVSNMFAPRTLVFTGLHAFILSLLVLTFSRSPLVSTIGVSMAGFGLVLFYVNANSALQRRVPHELRGRVMGVYALIFGGMRPFGSTQMGAITDWFGIHTAFVISSAILALSGFLVSRWVPPVPRPAGTDALSAKERH